MARENPQSLVIGIDPCQNQLIQTSLKALKKPSKGGLSNLLYVLANVENLPADLYNRADKVYINFPWGSLLQGVVLADKQTWQNIKNICKPGALVQIIFGYTSVHDRKEIERLNLPLLDNFYMQNILLAKLKALGFAIVNLTELKPYDLKNYPTTWAKKLSFGSDRNYYLLVLQNQ